MKVGDQVWFRGKFTKTDALQNRGVIETIDDDMPDAIGVRLDNGNFVWAHRSRLVARNDQHLLRVQL